MGARKLTDHFCSANGRIAEAAAKRAQIDIWDTIVHGLVFRVTPSGHRSFSFVYHIGPKGKRKKKRLSLGSYPEIKLSTARELAAQHKVALSNNQDPAHAKQEAQAKLLETVSSIAELYLNDPEVRRWKKYDQEAKLVRTYILPPLGNRPLASLTRRDVQEVLDHVKGQGKFVQSNRVLTRIKHFLNWAKAREYVTENVANGIKPTKETQRDRVLNDDEIATVWRASSDLGYPGRQYIRFLMLTASRRDEARLARWEEIDLQRRVWTLSADRTKTQKARTIPLSSLAVEVLAETPHRTGYVFRGRGEGVYANVVKPKAAIDRIADLPPWTLHDLRRTAATGLQELGVPETTVKRILGHTEAATIGKVASIYQRGKVKPAEAMAEALELWGEHIRGLVEDRQDDNVVPLRA
jgi:integrase